MRLEELTFSRVAEAIQRRVTDVPHRLAWELPTTWARESKQRLEEVRNRHRGERCFIAANGPSLRRMDLSRLRGETTIGMNRIYRMAASWGFSPSYLVVMDYAIQLAQIAAELQQVDIPQYLNWNGRRLFPRTSPATFMKMTFRPRFAADPRGGVWGGHSVTFVCLQLAYWMGFREVILLGKDHDYEQKGVPGKVLVADGKEQNHAMPGYYAPGQTWRIPDYKGEELGYRMARAAFEADGRKVLDATEGGKLTVFPKVEFKTLF